MEATMGATDTVPGAEKVREAKRDFEAFFQANYVRLARALFLLTNDRAEAEDQAQEAMVRVLERWDRVSRMDSPDGYLYRTAMNLNRSWRRRRTVAVRRGPRPERTPGPDEIAEVQDELDRTLASIPLPQRQALILVEWVGMTDVQAASALGVAPTSVRARISRARAALRDRQEASDV
jgi:RNA polymerase sigma-70 factor, ECF subfamily